MYVNGGSVWTPSGQETEDGIQTGYATQAASTDNFSAGDIISFSTYIDGTCQYDAPSGTVELTYD